MKNQIFKTFVDNSLFFDFLNNVCSKVDTYYQFDMNAYKKSTYNDNEILANFLLNIKNNYHMSKQSYVERPITYNNITTILRQICKANNIHFTSYIKYDRSKYCINFHIYFEYPYL